MDNYIFEPSYTAYDWSTTSGSGWPSINNSGGLYYTSTATSNTIYTTAETWSRLTRSAVELNGIIDAFSEAIDARPNIDDLKIDEEDLEKFLSEE